MHHQRPFYLAMFIEAMQQEIFSTTSIGAASLIGKKTRDASNPLCSRIMPPPGNNFNLWGLSNLSQLPFYGRTGSWKREASGPRINQPLVSWIKSMPYKGPMKYASGKRMNSRSEKKRQIKRTLNLLFIIFYEACIDEKCQEEIDLQMNIQRIWAPYSGLIRSKRFYNVHIELRMKSTRNWKAQLNWTLTNT